MCAIPPPALSGSGWRVESLRLSSQPDYTGSPCRILIVKAQPNVLVVSTLPLTAIGVDFHPKVMIKSQPEAY